MAKRVFSQEFKNNIFKKLHSPINKSVSEIAAEENIPLINEARQNGARLEPARDILNISVRTYQRWVKEGSSTADKRPHVKRNSPKNKLNKEEKAKLSKFVTSPDMLI
ncbi:MAG: hypothetical protein FH758_09085 [Firmicutes bacterium]|nr:hypothetical protein [Bacillota bacterium]